MKRLWIIIPVILAAVSCTSIDEVPTVSVTGSASVMMDPDILRFSVTASALSESTEDARMLAGGMIGSALRILDGYGIADDDIVTGHISVSPEYSWKDGESILTGQRAVYSLDVTLRSIDEAGDLFDSLSSIDGIEVGRIAADKEDKRAETMKARSLAVEDAYSKASVYANAAGYMLGDLISISDSSSPSAYAAPVLYEMASPKAGGTEYYPGKITVSDEVSVIYSLVR